MTPVVIIQGLKVLAKDLLCFLFGFNWLCIITKGASQTPAHNLCLETSALKGTVPSATVFSKLREQHLETYTINRQIYILKTYQLYATCRQTNSL